MGNLHTRSSQRLFSNLSLLHPCLQAQRFCRTREEVFSISLGLLTLYRQTCNYYLRLGNDLSCRISAVPVLRRRHWRKALANPPEMIKTESVTHHTKDVLGVGTTKRVRAPLAHSSVYGKGAYARRSQPFPGLSFEVMPHAKPDAYCTSILLRRSRSEPA